MSVVPSPPAPGLPGSPWFIPGAAPAPRSVDRSRLGPTLLVAAVIAVVVLGGIGLDEAIAAPSAGRVGIGGPVYVTAAPGWVESPADDSSGDGVTLQKGDAFFVAQAFSDYFGDDRDALAEAKTLIDDGSAQIRFGSDQEMTFGPNHAAVVGFLAVVTNQRGSATIDGELICMVLDGNAVVIEAFAPQGDLEPVIDDIETMLASVEVAR